MPFGNAQSLTNDELYAIIAYVLYLNDIIKDENFELNREELQHRSRCRTRPVSIDDDRETTEKEFWRAKPCMSELHAGRSQDHRPRAGARRDAGSRNGPKVDYWHDGFARRSALRRIALRRQSLASAAARGRRQCARRIPVVGMCHLSSVTGRYDGIPPIVGWPKPSSSRSWTNTAPRNAPILSCRRLRSASGRGNRGACGLFRKLAAGQSSSSKSTGEKS